MQLEWQVYPKQLAFFNATERELLYGGAAGGGKTCGQVMDAFIKALQYPGMKQLIFRKTYDELEKSVLREVEDIYPPSIWNYNGSKHTGKFRNGSIIDFGYLATDKDLKRYQSAQYDIIRFDELTHFSEHQYRYMMSRVRGRNNFPKQIKSSTNPGSEGHAWVKARFISAAPHNTTFTVNKMTRRFIPARVEDNLFLMKNNPEYLEWLDQLPEHERQALYFGNWDIFEGQYFTEWNYDKHTIPPFEIPKEWRRFRSMDWGYRDPAAVLWFAVAPNGRVYCYRELYETKLLAKDLAGKTRAISLVRTAGKPDGEAEEIAYTAASPDMWKEYGDAEIAGTTIAETFTKNGVPLIKADNTRISGWNRVREYLRNMDDGQPRLQVFRTCLNLIRTLPEMIFDDKFVEDVADGLEDHAPEALRYGLMSRPAPTTVMQKPEPKPFDPFDRGKTRKGGFLST